MGDHIDADGEFQSDKYPTCPAGKVPLSTKDETAQDLLWLYAQRRRAVDAGFADDIETALRAKGYEPPTTIEGMTAQVFYDIAHDDGAREMREKLAEAEATIADLRTANDRMSPALSAIEGALMDCGNVVPADETGYADAVREIVKQRDDARERIETEQKIRSGAIGAYTKLFLAAKALVDKLPVCDLCDRFATRSDYHANYCEVHRIAPNGDTYSPTMYATQMLALVSLLKKDAS